MAQLFSEEWMSQLKDGWNGALKSKINWLKSVLTQRLFVVLKVMKTLQVFLLSKTASVFVQVAGMVSQLTGICVRTKKTG